jgi:hypothetical protein
MGTEMLKPARVGFFIASLLAMPEMARAHILVIYPPQSYQAPFEFCPLFWPAYFEPACYEGHYPFYFGHHADHRNHWTVGSAEGVRVIKSGKEISRVLSQAE